MPRSRGALAGSLLILLGIWGAIVPFVGPEFGYATINHAAWSFTWGRLYLDVLPGAAAIIGGILLVATRNRLLGSIAGWLATAGGVWLVVGPEISRLWNHGVTAAGTYLGATWHQVAEAMGYHDGLGVIVTIIAALALGRLATRSRRELRLAGDETLVGRRPLHAHETELDAGGWRAVG